MGSSWVNFVNCLGNREQEELPSGCQIQPLLPDGRRGVNRAGGSLAKPPSLALRLCIHPSAFLGLASLGVEWYQCAWWPLLFWFFDFWFLKNDIPNEGNETTKDSPSSQLTWKQENNSQLRPQRKSPPCHALSQRSGEGTSSLLGQAQPPS